MFDLFVVSKVTLSCMNFLPNIDRLDKHCESDPRRQENRRPTSSPDHSGQEAVQGRFSRAVLDPEVVVGLLVLAELADDLDEFEVEGGVVGLHLGELVVVVLGHQRLHGHRACHGTLFPCKNEMYSMQSRSFMGQKGNYE